MIERGHIYWADLGPAVGSRAASRRPVLVIQSNSYNDSRLSTVLVAVVTSNTGLAALPGNLFLPSTGTGLPRDSVVNVTALVTLNKSDLLDKAGSVPAGLVEDIDRGLRRVLSL